MGGNGGGRNGRTEKIKLCAGKGREAWGGCLGFYGEKGTTGLKG